MQQFAQLGFPEMYERALVDPLFRPWAEHIVAEVKVGPGDRVLDIACGTGIVARLAQQRVGSAGRVVGVDINAGMLAVARGLATDIDWREGDAGALPVVDTERFDVVICQQGLQFFPDRRTAISEMRRVLAPQGRLAVSTWRSDDEMPFLRELRRIAEQHVGAIVDRRHSLSDASELESLLHDAGFRDTQTTTVSRTIRFPDGAAFIFLNAIALVGMSPAAKDLGDSDRQQMAAAIAADSRALLAANTDASGLTYDISANVALART